MPTKPEAALYKRVKENLKGCHITRLESRTGLGIPDCLLGFGPLVSGFAMLELKVVKGGYKVRLSPHQVAFSQKHAALGCPVFILVQRYHTADSTAKDSDLLLFSGSQAADLVTQGLKVTPLVEFPTSNADWEGIKDLLVAYL